MKNVVRGVLCFWTNCKYPEAHVPVLEIENFDQDAPFDFRDLTSWDDRGPFALQCVRELCTDHSLTGISNFHSTQDLICDDLESLHSSEEDRRLLVEKKKAFLADKGGIEKLLKVSEDKSWKKSHRV